MLRSIAFLSTIIALTACGGNNPETKPAEESKPGNTVAAQPAVINYQLVNIYPHDSTCFTEGLQWVGDKMLESGGESGQSDIRYADLNSGKVLLKVPMAKQFFGEGCTYLNGKVYQMTYKEKTCFVYDSASFKKIGEFNYDFGEGWGMTTNGKELIISNGGSNLFFYDPITFKEVKRIGVSNQYGPVGYINELELIKGYVYANIWGADQIVKIDTANGNVVGMIDLNDLRGKLGIAQVTNDPMQPEVLNGIAYDAKDNRIFITGKYWPKLCEVKFDN